MYAKQTKPRIRTATYATVVGRHTTRTGTPVRVGEPSAVEQPATHYAAHRCRPGERCTGR